MASCAFGDRRLLSGVIRRSLFGLALVGYGGLEILLSFPCLILTLGLHGLPHGLAVSSVLVI